MHIIALAALFVVLAVIAYLVIVNNANAQVVAAEDNVSVYYTGRLQNGTVFNSNVGQRPFQFTAGTNEVIEGFDNAVMGMKVGQNKTVTIPPSQAYGDVNQSLIINMPVTEFGNQTVKAGMIITETSQQSGQHIEGKVIAVNSTTATVNFNPALAGDTLVFTIKVVSIQKK